MMTQRNGDGVRGVGLHTSIQIGTLVAALSVVAYVLAPIRSQIDSVQIGLSQHTHEEGHSGVLAQLAAFRTDLAAVRAEIAGTDRLNSVQDRGFTDRLDFYRGAVASLQEKVSNIEQRIARMEALIMSLHGTDKPMEDVNEGAYPHGIPHGRSAPCYGTCHDASRRRNDSSSMRGGIP